MKKSSEAKRDWAPKQWSNYVTYASSVVGFFAIWQLLSGRAINAQLLPPPSALYSTVASMIVSGELVAYVSISAHRALVGYAVGCLVGTTIGVLIGGVGLLKRLLDPIIILLRPIPPVALIPLSIIWLGIEEPSRYFIIAWATSWAMIFNMAAGVSATPLIRIRAARCLGASRLEVFWEVILPSAVPYMLAGMRLAVGSAFGGLVAAEMIAAQSGIGYMIMQSRVLIQTEQMFVGLVLLGVICASADHLFRWLSERAMRRYMQYLYYA